VVNRTAPCMVVGSFISKKVKRRPKILLLQPCLEKKSLDT
jgi:hypothetical protein